MRDEHFDQTLRSHLPFLGPGEALHDDADLRDLGLDSLGTVELLASLENRYNVRFVDDALTLETFATPGTLWNTLSRMAGTAS
ncbi:MAG: acyl carrier protein [Hamadaea sp.]|uniref:phosphopantetheine-binding protein n=1 Tax=Hamadaea sp. TaxID=2024425 RepID=UPI0018028430|nr:phosphopantetheine-binding protein [Hamadaea sp.]NUR69269.1 acyl carrier protein [Hamadaea sp.]NUT22027.1 acyl carrier protein [Hamadaea sp.]